MTEIEELRALIKKLDNLLQSPEPGLFTWQHEIRKILNQIKEF